MLDRDLDKAMSSPLWLELVRAHRLAAYANQPVSNAVCAAVAAGSGSFAAGVAAAILSTGGKHAPFAEARKVLRGDYDRDGHNYHGGGGDLQERVAYGWKVPGFGNSFHRHQIDPAFSPLALMLRPATRNRILSLAGVLWGMGKKVHPNAAMFTAAVLEELELPDEFGLVAFVLGRLPEWALAAALARE